MRAQVCTGTRPCVPRCVQAPDCVHRHAQMCPAARPCVYWCARVCPWLRLCVQRCPGLGHAYLGVPRIQDVYASCARDPGCELLRLPGSKPCIPRCDQVCPRARLHIPRCFQRFRLCVHSVLGFQVCHIPDCTGVPGLGLLCIAVPEVDCVSRPGVWRSQLYL